MDIETLGSFFMWGTIINAIILVVATLVFLARRRFISGLHSRMFDISENQVLHGVYIVLGIYKFMILLFFVTPWIALSLM